MPDDSHVIRSSHLACAKFKLGQIVTTSHARSKVTNEAIWSALYKHVTGDWGGLDEHDLQVNDRDLVEGNRLVSLYQSASGVKFYIITESNRSVTAVLLPEDC
jgi:hypothetical protein